MKLVTALSVPKLAKKARLTFDRHASQWMLLYPERGLALNDAAAAIAKKCDGTRSVAVIADELAREHECASREAIERDVLAFVQGLAERGLLDAATLSSP